MCSQLVLVGHLLLTINSSVNFPVYYLGNCRKVARLVVNLCCVTQDMVSPPDLMAIERERVERNAAAHTTLPDPVTASTEDELPGQLPSIVESILENTVDGSRKDKVSAEAME